MKLKTDVTAVVLAGGMGRRMEGSDKGLINIGGREMIAYVIDTLQQNVDKVMVNANRNLERYQAYSVDVVPDSLQGYQGPLAGVEAALSAADTNWVFTCPCDSPMQSAGLLPHMWAEISNSDADIGVAYDGNRTHPVFLILRRELLESLRDYLGEGERKIDRWFSRHKLLTIDCSNYRDSFINVNTDDERIAVEQHLSSAG